MLPHSWERRLVDLNVAPLGDADLEWADIVFVSAMIVQKASLEDVVSPYTMGSPLCRGVFMDVG